MYLGVVTFYVIIDIDGTLGAYVLCMILDLSLPVFTSVESIKVNA